MYDLLGQRLVDRLREYGQVITPEMVDLADIRTATSTIYQGERMWTFEGEKLGAAFHLMRNDLVDRLVLVGPFGCGPQSVMENFIMTEAERHGVPFLHLTVDEHTGEAGIVTRLEAFMDMHQVSAESAHQDVIDKNPYDISTPVRGREPASRKVGTAQMGYLNLGVEAILQLCGVETVPMPKLTQDLIERLPAGGSHWAVGHTVGPGRRPHSNDHRQGKVPGRMVRPGAKGTPGKGRL